MPWARPAHDELNWCRVQRQRVQDIGSRDLGWRVKWVKGLGSGIWGIGFRVGDLRVAFGVSPKRVQVPNNPIILSQVPRPGTVILSPINFW